MTTLEFATLARRTLRSIPASSFQFELCSSHNEYGCAVHWMFKTGTLSTEGLERYGYWDALTGDHLCPDELRNILGFNNNGSCALYGVDALYKVTKAQVVRQLKEYINANS